MLSVLTVSAQTINVRGKVLSKTGNPVASAIVTLVEQGLKDTTSADGSYAITKNDVAVLPLLVPQNKFMVLKGDILEFSLPEPSPVKVEIFDVKGKLLKRVSQDAYVGFYRFNVAEYAPAYKVFIMRISIGQNQYSFNYLPSHYGKYVVSATDKNSAPFEGNRLTKVMAVNDTLKVTAAGYVSQSVPLTSYDKELTITLESSGSVVRSSGCGKSTLLKGETIQHIDIGNQKNREYIISLPNDYDPGTAYKLWFGFHCNAGTDTGVAKGSTKARGAASDTHYEYYGIWKFANPAGEKGTTIFCAPQGIGKQWGNGGGSDVQFIRTLIQKFESELCIDESGIFSEGFSMGGSMSYALACAMPDTFRAICMHSGGGMSGCDGSHRGPMPIFITHGTDDPTCTWPGNGFPQFKDLAERNGCDPIDVPGLAHPTDQMHPITFDYKNCDAGKPAKACIFKGGHNPSPGTEGPWGEANTWVDDSTWSFFKQFY